MLDDILKEADHAMLGHVFNGLDQSLRLDHGLRIWIEFKNGILVIHRPPLDDSLAFRRPLVSGICAVLFFPLPCFRKCRVVSEEPFPHILRHAVAWA